MPGANYTATDLPPTAHIEETLIGVLALTSDGAVIEKALYGREPSKIAKAITRQRNGELTREVTKVVEALLKRGFEKVSTTNAALAESIRSEYGIEVEVVDSGPTERLTEELPEIAVRGGIVQTRDALTDLGREVGTIVARGGVQSALGGREALITQVVQLLGELDTSLNGLSARMRELYGLHYPELSRALRDHQTYARFVTLIGDRSSATMERLEELGLQRRDAQAILTGAPGSMGAEFGPEDMAEAQRLAGSVLGLYEYRTHLNEYASGLAKEVAPNLSTLAGPVLAAKLIERAGGLRRLAMMPSSTLQILGAEKALYRSRKTRAKPPKHGLIFQHPYVNGAPRGLRGIRARHLAAKLVVAARADAFSGHTIAEELAKGLEEARNERPRP